MSISYNKAKAEEGGHGRLKPGTYLCRVEDAQERTSRNGNPMLNLRFQLVDGGSTACFDNLVFSEKGVGIAHKKLKMLGYALPERGEECFVEASDLIGLEANLTLVEEEYEGKKNLKPDFNADGFGYGPTTSQMKATTKSKASAPSSDENIPPF